MQWGYQDRQPCLVAVAGQRLLRGVTLLPALPSRADVCPAHNALPRQRRAARAFLRPVCLPRLFRREPVGLTGGTMCSAPTAPMLREAPGAPALPIVLGRPIPPARQATRRRLRRQESRTRRRRPDCRRRAVASFKIAAFKRGPSPQHASRAKPRCLMYLPLSPRRTADGDAAAARRCRVSSRIHGASRRCHNSTSPRLPRRAAGVTRHQRKTFDPVLGRSPRAAATLGALPQLRGSIEARRGRVGTDSSVRAEAARIAQAVAAAEAETAATISRRLRN